MEQIELTARIVLEEYAAQLSRSYNKRLRAMALGVGDTKLDTAIYQVARICLEHKLDPRHYVSVVMDILREPLPGEGNARRMIKPGDLHTTEMLSGYMKRLKTGNGGDPDHRWKAQVDQLKRIRLLNPQYTTDSEALIMFSFPFDSWFRVMYVKPVHERIFKVYGASAWDDLREDRFLREYLRTVAPENMQELERRIAKFIESV
jgi:hypothetical protein